MALVGTAFARCEAGRWVHRFGRRVAGAVAVPACASRRASLMLLLAHARWRAVLQILHAFSPMQAWCSNQCRWRTSLRLCTSTHEVSLGSSRPVLAVTAAACPAPRWPPPFCRDRRPRPWLGQLKA